jgi:ABC-2 type transport system ATP-binding protein
MGETGNFVELRGVTKKYKDVVALDNASFNIKRGDIFGYIGPNGAGKTTTLKILVGLIQDFQGDVFCNGVSVRDNRSEMYKILGYLPQSAGFQAWRTANHALTTFGRLSGLSGEQLELRIKVVLEIVGLSDVRHKKIVNFSGGMVQKLGLAQALLHEPKLLVLDEPMTGLDPASRFQIKQILKQFSKEGVTILFSSHILSDVQDIASQIGIIGLGKILKVGSPSDLQDHFKVGDEIEIMVADGSRPVESLEKIASVKDVARTSQERSIIRLTPGSNLDESITAILQELIRQGCHLRNFNLLRPSLEEIYMKFIGGSK